MTKLNQILSKWQPGDVHTLSWLSKHGVEQRTAYQYAQSNSLQKIGSGVFCRQGDNLHWAGAVRAIQEELGLQIHVGGQTALYLHGSAHQLSLGGNIILITYTKQALPKWVQGNDWNTKIQLKRSSLFKVGLTYDKAEVNGIKVSLAPRELAILEYTNNQDLSRSFESLSNQMQGLRTLRSRTLQELLEACCSVKVKRVFLYLSEQLSLPFFKKLDLDRIDLGSGKRVLAKNGKFNSKYLITVPKDSEDNPF